MLRVFSTFLTAHCLFLKQLYLQIFFTFHTNSCKKTHAGATWIFSAVM